MHIPTIPPSGTPLTTAQQGSLNQILATLDPVQSSWLSGYLAGVSQSMGGASPAPAPIAEGAGLTILYGSQTGNSEGIAEQMKAAASARNIPASVKSMGDYKNNALKKEKNVAIIISTHGEGDPPDTAIPFHEYVYGKRAPKLEGVNFTVLALGDTSYEHFCKTGQDFDEQFAALGGSRLLDRVDCDLDYETQAEAWIDAALDQFGQHIEAGAPTAAVTAWPGMGNESPTSQYNKKNPFNAPVLEQVVLNGRGSGKEVHHIELSLEESGLIYEPGDALGVLPQNDPAMIDEILSATGLDGSGEVETWDGPLTLHTALSSRYEITTLTRPVLKQWAEVVGAKDLTKLFDEGQRDALNDYLYGRELIDLLLSHPAKGMTATDFVALLRKLPPRLYSIASSLKANPEEVHLTVGATRYTTYGRDRKGVASTFLAERIDEDAGVPVYVDSNKNFKLPADPSTPIIMVGPGTGIAPFRSFVQDRAETGATGGNWLFFGDQHFNTDFYYQTEWQRFLKDGVLTHLDVAFSRDQADKIYVQHRMLEKASELYDWLNQGAYFYVCGDEKHMAHDVHSALIQIASEQGGKSSEDAEAWVQELQKDKRYQRDVY